MNKIVYDSNLIKIMSLFESVTGVQPKDCVNLQGEFVFVVNASEAGKAIGGSGRNARALENSLRARIKIVEFSDNPVTFIKSLIYPLQATEVSSVDGTLLVRASDGKTRGLLIGRNATKLRSFEAIVQRYFPVKEVRVE